jgi:hypothetical protein
MADIKQTENSVQEQVQEVVQQEPPAEEPKKRYYSPGEVMKKKGCIGCGGMALAIPLLAAILLVVAVI